MSDPAEPFVLDPQAAAHALLLAEAAARNVLELRGDSAAAELHVALFNAPLSSDSVPPDATDSRAVIGFMDQLLIADHGAPDTAVPVEALGVSRKEITRLTAFECVHTGVDAYVAILTERKFDGATRSYGSRRFAQTLPGGGETPLIAAASGWRADQDYLAAMMVPATLHYVLLEFGVLPRAGIVSSAFLLADGAWEYPVR